MHHLASVHFWQVLFLAMCWMRIGHCTLYIGHCTLDIAQTVSEGERGGGAMVFQLLTQTDKLQKGVNLLSTFIVR